MKQWSPTPSIHAGRVEDLILLDWHRVVTDVQSAFSDHAWSADGFQRVRIYVQDGKVGGQRQGLGKERDCYGMRAR